MPLLQWLQTLKVGHFSLIRCSYVLTKKEENEIKQILITASSIVSHFKHSTVVIKALQLAQKKLKMPEKKLIQSVKTRWNSIYAMVLTYSVSTMYKHSF